MLKLKPSIGTCLGVAGIAVVMALLFGMRLAQRSTAETVKLTGSVESQYEPVLSKSRELTGALSVFERDVVVQTQPTSASSGTVPKLPTPQLLDIFDGYLALAGISANANTADLRARFASHQTHGLEIAEWCRQRRTEAKKSLVALDELVARAVRAGRGVESGDQVISKTSLAEVSRTATALRDSVLIFYASRSARTSAAATKNEKSFATFLRLHGGEFTQAPGRAWLELMRDDFRAAARARSRYSEMEATIDAARIDFTVTSAQLGNRVVSDLQQPAWRELTRAAGGARAAAESTEKHLSRVTFGILGVVLLICAMILIGVAIPVRRLLAGTRRLARGALDARVSRGGVRELDELAGAFNDMAEALHNTQKTLQDQQAVLEERIVQRTADLRHLAHHDALTDLPNRRELSARLNASIENARAARNACAVLYMDVDNFKTINDSLGHQFGDRVLREISARLLEVVGTSGFLARLGGDEFTLVVENIADAAAAERYASQVMRAFATPLRVAERDLLVGLSIGVALFPEHGESTDALLRAADSALYDAKDRGRNGFQVYRAELLVAASHRFNTEQGLRRALENNDFLLHFQPEISLLDHRTSVVEALLRWRQADGRIASAGEFIEIAERSGVMLELSDWLLRKAVNAARKLRAAGWAQAKIAINVSAQQFLSGRFVESVARALREADMSADCLEIELTESALQTGRRAIEALHELRRLGVAIALDDFGTGYSTLKSIEALPLTRVKLDRSLIRDIEFNDSAAAIAHAFVSLCQNLGLAVTAEGVETVGQLDSLSVCGDLQVQGFLIARPGPLEQVGQFIAESQARMASIWPQATTRSRDGVLRGEVAPVTFLRPRAR